MVVALDRLGRSLSGTIRTIETLPAAGVQLRSLRESIDTTTAVGRMLTGVFGSLAEYVRTLINERSAAAREARRARGLNVGRPKALTPDQVRQLRTLIPYLTARTGNRPSTRWCGFAGTGRTRGARPTGSATSAACTGRTSPAASWRELTAPTSMGTCGAVEGEVSHSCLHGPPPHSIKICITAVDNGGTRSLLTRHLRAVASAGGR